MSEAAPNVSTSDIRANDPENHRSQCPNCGAEGNRTLRSFQERFSELEGELYGETRYFIVQCGGCEGIYFVQRSTFSENIDYEQDRLTGESLQTLSETVKIFPTPKSREWPAWVQAFISPLDTQTRELALEVYSVIDGGHLTLGAIGIRTLFDRASQALGIEHHLPFAEKLAKLQKADFITGKQKDALSILIDAGSAAAHRGWKPTNSEVHLLLSILEGVITQCIVLPAEISKGAPSPPKRDERR